MPDFHFTKSFPLYAYKIVEKNKYKITYSIVLKETTRPFISYEYLYAKHDNNKFILIYFTLILLNPILFYIKIIVIVLLIVSLLFILFMAHTLSIKIKQFSFRFYEGSLLHKYFRSMYHSNFTYEHFLIYWN